VVADALARAPSPVAAFVPGAVLGLLLLLTALVFGGFGLGGALFLAGATYVAAVASAGQSVDASALLVAALLILCGELSAWSLDERLELEAEPALTTRRGVAVATLGLSGLAAAALVVALSSVGPSHGLGWTVLGAAAALAAAGSGIWVAHR
jgi:hypothetical protein